MKLSVELVQISLKNRYKVYRYIDYNSVFVPLFAKFSLSNGLHMFTAWPYWFSLVHATYRPDQGNQLCTLEIRAKLGGYQLQTSFLPSALWERQKRWEFPPPNGNHEQSY